MNDKALTVCHHLLNKPALAWEVAHALLQPGVLAGPWTPIMTDQCDGMFRPAIHLDQRVVSIRGFHTMNHWDIIFHGATQHQDKNRTAPKTVTLAALMDEIDAELEQMSYALVPGGATP